MVNITMLVRNRPRLTRQALQFIDTCETDWNITVLDDRSDSETRDLLDFWNSVGYHRTVCRNNFSALGTGQLRNHVIRAAESSWGRGTYLYLSDNDVYFKAGWLDTLIACYEDCRSRGFKVLGAYNHPYHQPIGELQFIHNQPNHRVYEVQALALQSMFMSWEVWDKYGPFCETPEGKVCQGEDVDFTNKIKADGGKIGVVSPALVVNTGITNSFGEKIPGWEMVKAQCPAGVICE